MRNYKFIFGLFFIVQSCVTPKAKFTNKGTINNNSAIFSVNGAALNSKKSAIGIATQIISTGIGGYLGYKYFPVALGYKNEKLNMSSLGGSVVGGIAGYGINNSLNYLLGEKKIMVVNQSNYSKWKRSFDPTNRFIALNTNYSALEFIDKSYEKNFIVNNFQDAVYFKKAFPQSPYSKKIFDDAVNVSNRYSLQELSKLYPNENQENLTKKHLLSSTNFDEYKQSVDLFPSNKVSAESHLATSAKTYQEVRTFLELYPESKYKAELLEKIMKTETIFSKYTRDELKRIPSIFRIKNENIENQISNRIISLATSLNETNEDLRSYPNKRASIEDKAIEFVVSSLAFDEFKSQFPNSKYIHVFTDGVFEKLGGVFIGKYWDVVNKRPSNTGKGVFKSKDEIYVGSYNNGEKNGYGILDANLINVGYEVRYEGQFSDGKLNGKGKFQDNNPDCKITYEGEFKNNLFDGNGSASGKLGDCYSWFGNGFATYTGGWKEGKLNGNGKYTMGEMWYDGNFERGAMNGYGMLRLPNGIRIEGNWKMHNPNGRMHLFKFTLLGLVRDDQYVEAYSMKDLASGETKFISDWNSSRNSSPSNEDDNKAEREEKLNEEKLANDRKNQEDIKKCMLDINKSLKKLTFKEESVFNDCPCVFFEDPSFWGYRLELRENKDNEWYYRITALLNFKGWQGPYTSKDDMLKSVCENDFK